MKPAASFRTWRVASSLSFVGVVGLVALAGCGGSGRPAASPDGDTANASPPVDGRPDACPTVLPMLRKQTARLENATEALVGDDRSVTGILGSIHAIERAFLDTATELRAARFVDRANAADATLVAAELDEARKGLEGSRVRLEDAMRQASTPLREAREKAWELRTMCEASRKPSGDCRALLRAFPDSELSTWTTIDGVDQAMTKLDRVAVKDANTARDVQTVKQKLEVAAAAMRKLLKTGKDNKTDAFSTHAGAAKAAMDRLKDRCGTTKLLPTDWIAAPSGTDPRKLTVLVYGLLPDPMRPIFDPSGAKGPDLTSGSTGSGVIVVRRVGASRKVFVVTNRHVVTEAMRAKIVADGSDEWIDARVVYVDPRNDVAVLEVSPGGDAKVPFDAGVSLETNVPVDQQTVVAAGFPGMGGRPSYQVTRGYISNHEVRVGGGDFTTYIQHTAPIDPGSSGGPLLSERGGLLGVNTLKLRGREGVGLAVPAEVVVDALHAAESAPPPDAREVRLACLSTLGDLTTTGGTEPGRHLSSAFVAESGPPAFARMTKTASKADKEAMSAAYEHDPVGTLRLAALGRLEDAIGDAGGVSTLEMCENVTLGGSGDDLAARFIVQTVRGPREMKMVRERGQWTVASFDFRDGIAKATAKPAAGVKKKSGRSEPPSPKPRGSGS